MSKITLIPQWHNDINQVEKNEPILGGAGGNANQAVKQLAENILWLKQNMQAHRVGDIYTTTINHADALAVATHHGYGTWERFAKGRTLVGFSTVGADPADYKTMGNEFGENEHTLTVDEIPSHNHNNGEHERLLRVTGKDTAFGGDLGAGLLEVDARGAVIVAAGGDQSHNNIQPSVVVAYWLRTD